jgi:uncharacterized protein YndB with AHSA1/START domain
VSQNDRIEKKVVLRAPRDRVWRAISDAREFGTWFGMEVAGAFAPGAVLDAVIRPTKMDPEVAKQQAPYAGYPFRMIIDRVEPERVVSFRWHPYALDAGTDPATEPMTTVVFEIADAPGGVLLTITESGFDRVPLARRAKAFADNERGWTEQVRLVEKYLAQAA